LPKKIFFYLSILKILLFLEGSELRQIFGQLLLLLPATFIHTYYLRDFSTIIFKIFR